MQDWAVFTGDIVRSSGMSAAELSDMFAALERQCHMIADWPESRTHFMRYRGDGWQMALPVRYALRAALVMRAAARATGKGHDTRFGIGLGAAQIESGDLAAAEGPAFVQAGDALDAMKRGPLMSAPDAPDLLQIALPLADKIARDWTAKQAQIAAALLVPEPPTQEVLAGTLGHSRQLIQKQADTAGVSALIDSFTAFERVGIEK